MADPIKLNNPIDRQSKEDYEYFLKKCTQYTHLSNAKMYANLDDKKYQARITLYHPFFEFVDKQNLKFLKEISKCCDSITFSIEKEEIKIVILIYYFTYAYEEIQEMTEQYNLIQKECRFEP